MDIFIARDGNQTGPFTLAQVEGMLDAGTVALDDQAWHAELTAWTPLHKVLDVDPLSASVYRPPVTPLTATSGDAEGRYYLYIPTARLIFMSLITLGLYEQYWMYMNWRYLKLRNHLAIRPFWRSVFAYFYICSLLDAIKRDSTSQTGVIARYAAGPLAAAWILLAIAGNVFGESDDFATKSAGLIFSVATFCFLLPVQRHINAINDTSTERPAYLGWTVGQILLLLSGLLLWLLVLVSTAYTYYPEEVYRLFGDIAE